MTPILMAAVNSLVEVVTGGMAERNAGILSQIVRDNCDRGNVAPGGIFGFRHMGQTVLAQESTSRPGRTTEMPLLASDLHERYSRWQSLVSTLEQDREYIRQCFITIIRTTNCASLQDLRNILSDRLAEKSDQLSDIARSSDQAERLASFDMAKRYLGKVEDRLDYYIGLSLLF